VGSAKKYDTFEYTGSALVLIEKTGIISMANHQFEKISGFSHEEIVGKMYWMSFIHPKDVKRLEDYWKRHQINREENEEKFRLLTKCGAIREILLTICLIPGTSQCIGSLIDITEHRKTENALKESKERAMLLLESIEDGFYEVDMAGNLIYANAALARIFGINDKEKHIGINYRNYMDEENASFVFHAFNKVFDSGRPEKGLIWDIKQNDGTKRTVEVSISPVRDLDERLFNLAGRFIEAANLSERELNCIKLLDQYHDIGKAGISDEIIFKPGPLSKTEWVEMKQHSEIGFRIAKSTPDLSSMADWILLHHEWWNGKGYPQGLKGQEIPLLCRIFAITDAYDAMTTVRPYRKTISGQEALAEIERCAGTQFDPDLVKHFIMAMVN